MSNKVVLYVDGACRGNPGIGGWGVYKEGSNGVEQFCGGMLDTTNNRMELTAAIEGILQCSPDVELQIWTDSSYVKRGMTEWITGWKKKNWKDVKNVELWKLLDQVSQNRHIDWQWIKGHAGHFGNEQADKLANMGTDLVAEDASKIEKVFKINHEQAEFIQNVSKFTDPSLSQKEQTEAVTPKQSSDDWLLADPFGLDAYDEDETLEETQEIQQDTSAVKNETVSLKIDDSVMAHIHITAATEHYAGERQLVLDTETTGFHYHNGDRIIEVGAIELVNRKLTGSSIHIYIQPEREVGESVTVHNITDEFLQDKPVFAQIAQVLYDYLKGAEIIAHNASFDMGFLDMEFEKVGMGKLSDVCKVVDTLALAKQKFPGQRNTLDALSKRYADMIQKRDRTFHGALLDSEILADVYLAMTGGQVALDIDASFASSSAQGGQQDYQKIEAKLPTILPSDEELQAHFAWVKKYAEKNGKDSIFAQWQ